MPSLTQEFRIRLQGTRVLQRQISISVSQDKQTSPSIPLLLTNGQDQQRPEITVEKTGVFRRAPHCPDGRRD